MNNESKILSVEEVNGAIKGILEGIPLFSSLLVKGEISNWKAYRTGVFFDLKGEEGSVLSCTIWNNYLERLSFLPKNGDEVLAKGRISVYQKGGRYSLSAYSLERYGDGAALLALEALKRKLAAEGLFDEKRKRSLPFFPKAIGVICGKGSAAESDILTNIARRYPIAEIYVYNAIVQGKEAPKSILDALKRAASSPIDVLILARGGGSNEDLSAFNDEGVVRAFAAFPKPTISAVGHEIDTTLVDFASDKRASTPTGAAEAATPDILDIRTFLLSSERRLLSSLEKTIERKEEALRSLSSRPFFKDALSGYEKVGKDLKAYQKRLENGVATALFAKERALDALKARLQSVSPLSVLGRGYSMLLAENGNLLSSAESLPKGKKFKAVLRDGNIEAVSLGKEKADGGKENE